VTLGSTAALQGTGGFGKTTLALDVCRQPSVRALFPDGIYWIEVGQEPILTALLADLVAWITGNPAVRFGSIPPASVALADALRGRRMLLVLDNVWSSSDLEPFLTGGRLCVRLVTSRRADVAPAGSAVVHVDRMAPATALEVLLQDLPGVGPQDVYPLYGRSHRWPVVLGLLNGILRSRLLPGSGIRDAADAADAVAGEIVGPTAHLVTTIVASLVARLDSEGLTGADDLVDEQERTVREVLAIGVEELGSARRGSVLRQRYLSLAAFPPDQLIRYELLQQLWGSDALETRSSCDRFADRSLLGGSEVNGVRLHDVVRDQLLRDHHLVIANWARTLLSVIRRHTGAGWHELPDEYSDDLDQLAFLLVSTDQEEELRNLLFDLRFLVRRLQHGGVAAVGADLAVCATGFARDPQLSELSRVMDLEGHIATRVNDRASVAGTLYSRLVGHPRTVARISHVTEALAGALTAQGPLPDRPDDRLRVVLSHQDRVIACCWQPNGSRLASGTDAGGVRVWDEQGRLLRTIEFDAAVNALAWSSDQLHLAALVGDRSVWLIEPIHGDRQAVLADTQELTCLAWDPNHARLAVGRADGTLVLLEDRQQPKSIATGSDASVRALAWTRTTGLVSANSDGVLTRHPPTGDQRSDRAKRASWTGRPARAPRSRHRRRHPWAGSSSSRSGADRRCRERCGIRMGHLRCLEH